jgi:dTDP-4-amino-4,6-dideoxygalactose transaminase
MAIDQVLCDGPFHMFPLIMPDEKTRNQLLNHLHNQSISATFHYVPLHNSPAGLKFGTSKDGCINSENISRQLIRLPLFSDIKDKEIDKVIEMTLKFKR